MVSQLWSTRSERPQGWFLLRTVRESRLFQASYLDSGGWWAISGVPYLEKASLQSLLLSLHGIRHCVCVCVCLSSNSPLYKANSHIV